MDSLIFGNTFRSYHLANLLSTIKY